MSFYEVCKILISTDSFHKDGVPHIMLTAINFYTQENPVSVEFDYKAAFDREDKYNDIVGFYHTHPSGMNRMSQIDIDTMTQWVKCLGKSLICVIETEEKKNGWLFSKDEAGNVSYREVHVSSVNDVNYDVWLDAKANFWNPADFLLDGEFFMGDVTVSNEDDEYDDEIIEMMMEKLDQIGEGVNKLTTGFNSLLDALQRLMGKGNEKK